jgi:hypothetical protein
MNGIEILKNAMITIRDLRADHNKKHNIVDTLDLKSNMRFLNENIKNLINTNDFMTMTINRCIDYTKVSFKCLFSLNLFNQLIFCRRAKVSNWTRASKLSTSWK